MKKILYILSVMLLFSQCSLFEAEEILNPNAPDAASALDNASLAQIQLLVNGLESRHKSYVTGTAQAYGSFGREVFVYFDSDPRFTRDWLGRAGIVPDPNFFGVGGGPYAFPYQAIKHGFFIMDAAANSTNITDQERSALNGFVKTIQAYQFMIPLNGLYQNGIRFDVENTLNPGKIISYDEALIEILALLNEAQTDLNNGGASFPFTLNGFAGFDTPSSFLEFNRAIMARAGLYAEDWNTALTAVNASYLDLAGSLDTSPTHPYGGPPDIFNPLFFVPDQFSTQIVVVHPSVLNDIEVGDNRADKFLARSTENLVNNSEFTEYVGTHQDARYSTNTEPISYLRNEELILILAEARAQTNDLQGAVDAINVVRSAAGLADFVNPGNVDVIIDQILTERRFSLWFEPWGHRWIDARRYDKLNEIPTISTEETIFTQLEVPQSELNFDSSQGG